jgi:two-component system, sensor histidine kinase and response regulator
MRWRIRQKRDDIQAADVDLKDIPLKSKTLAEREFGLGFFKSIAEHSRDSITVITPDDEGKLIYANRAYTQTYGHNAEDVLGKPSPTLPPEEFDRTWDLRRRALQGEDVEPYEAERITKDGRRITVSVTMFALKDDFGKPIGLCRISRDVTERKRLEEAERKARMESATAGLLGDFFGDTLINKLTPAIMSIDMAAGSQNIHPSDKALLSEADISLRDVVFKTTIFSNAQNPRFFGLTSEQDVKAIIKESVGGRALSGYDKNEAALAEGDTLSFDRPSQQHLGLDDIPKVMVSDIGFRISLNETLINAIESRKTGDRDKGEPRHLPVHVAISAKLDGKELVLSVRDDGRGMSEEDVEKCQLPFYKVLGVKTSGRAGLGAYLALKAAQSFGGDINIESAKNKGTTAHIRVPLP